MKIVGIADVHAANHRRFGGQTEQGLNARARAILAALADAANEVVESGAGLLLVCGDLYDTARPESQLEAAVGEQLRRATEGGARVLLMAGNHEQVSTAPGDHALGPLGLIPGVRVVERPFIDYVEGWEVWAVPNHPGADGAWLEATLASMLDAQRGQDGRARVPPHTRRLLALHFGISDSLTPAFMRGIAGSVDVDVLGKLVDAHGFDVVLSGDWHVRKMWRSPKSASIVQVGALVPTGFDNPGFDGYGSVIVVDDQGLAPGQRARVEVLEVPGPRFVKTVSRTEADEAMKRAAAEGHELFLSYSAATDELTEAAAWLEQCSKKGLVENAEVVPDTAVARAEAQTAATAARSATTLDEATAAFVGAMPLADGVSRDNVLAHVRRYLA